jgi:hypothetical protein
LVCGLEGWEDEEGQGRHVKIIFGVEPVSVTITTDGGGSVDLVVEQVVVPFPVNKKDKTPLQFLDDNDCVGVRGS